jgi:hypothetical protein
MALELEAGTVKPCLVGGDWNHGIL